MRRRGKATKLWAELILMDIYSKESGTADEALRTAEHLHEVFPDNAFFQLSLADCYRERRQWAPAEWVYGSIQEKVMKRTPGYDEVVFEVSRLRTVECQVRLGKMEEAFNTVREILITNPINRSGWCPGPTTTLPAYTVSADSLSGPSEPASIHEWCGLR